jgi:hypothetical protein
MPKQSIADLLSEADQATPAESPVLPPHPAPPAAAPVSAASSQEANLPRHRPTSGGHRRRGAGTAGVTESQTPKWKGLERKELRLRADQLDELARLRRILNRQRGGEGERITENTLIRVAVDLLLTRSGHLRGITEDQLRKSVTS